MVRTGGKSISALKKAIDWRSTRRFRRTIAPVEMIHLDLPALLQNNLRWTQKMKSKPKIQRSLFATLMVLAIAATGLQPLVSGSAAECSCHTSAAVAADLASSPSSCCSEIVQTHASVANVKSCCSAIQSTTDGCCCNPEAAVCQCGDCQCGEVEAPSFPSPAIPANQTTEAVTPVLICAAPFVCFPKQAEFAQAGLPKSVADYAALSSQETCVLLSRFTC